MQALKRLATRSKHLLIARHVLDNLRVKRQADRGKTARTASGATHGQYFDLEGSLDYIQRVFDDYLTYGRLARADVAGKRILEIGPGDNFGVALLFLAAGASQVVCLDKFYSERDDEQQKRIYAALRERLAPGEQGVFDEALSLDGGITLREERLRYLHGKGMEEAAEFFDAGSFDLIVSRAVVEHLYDTDAAFAAMDALLAPGGWMLHKVDLRDHQLFSGYGLHPLTFLTIPDRVYYWMSYHSGKPNRQMMPYYRDKLREMGYETRIHLTHILGSESDFEPHPETLVAGTHYEPAELENVRRIYPRLRERYRRMTPEELLVTGIFLIARKPDA